MVAHDVSKEARGYHGKWVRVGMPAPDEARGPFTMHRMEVEARIAELPKGKRISLNGVTIDNIPSKGLRVRVGKESRFYDTPEAAAKAVMNKSHHEDTSKTQVRERAVRKIAQPEPSPAPGLHGVPSIPIIPVFRTRYPGRTPENDKAIRIGIRKATDIQRGYVPDIVNNTTVTVQTKPSGHTHSMGTYASTGRVPTLTNEAMLESRRTGEPPKVMSGIKGDMKVRPDIFIAGNRQDTLNHCVATRWWVPTNTDKYDLSDTVIAHEIGHGVHGQLGANGIEGFGWNPIVKNAESLQFWQDLADAIDVPRPVIEKHAYDKFGQARGVIGTEYMSVDTWLHRNKTAIQQKVSTYGGKKNVRELTAELWAEYTLSDHPRPGAKFYGDFVMAKIGGAKGVHA